MVTNIDTDDLFVQLPPGTHPSYTKKCIKPGLGSVRPFQLILFYIIPFSQSVQLLFKLVKTVVRISWATRVFHSAVCFTSFLCILHEANATLPNSNRVGIHL